MKAQRDAPHHDLPDKFGRLEFAEHISSLLYDRDARKATGLVVGLTGPWGSGKSQTLHYVRKHLHAAVISRRPNNENPLVLISYNPWLHSGRDDLVQTFFQSAKKATKEHEIYYPQLDRIVSLFDRFAGVVRLLNVMSKAHSITKGLSDELSKAKPLEEQRDVLLEGFALHGVSSVVFLDELDRLSDEEIRGMMQVVKSLADFPSFSYLLAYDPDRVAKALGGADLKFGHNYLEKIVQVQVRLPRTSEEKMKPFIREQFESGPDFDSRILDEVLDSLVPDVIYTPRDARRLAAAYAARSAVKNEVDQRDLLKYCALESRIPVLSERLQNLAGRVTVDGARELERRPAPLLPMADCIARLLDVFRDDKSLERLLLDLFPALEEFGTEFIVRDDNRLCYETSLLSLLNYGRPPNSIAIEEVEAALKDPTTGIPALLAKAVARGCIRQACLRLRTSCRKVTLPNDKVIALWSQVGIFFDRTIAAADMGTWTPWVDAAHVWARGVLQGYLPQHPITYDFVSRSIETGQMLLPAWILYFHIQAYGLFGVELRSGLHPKLTQDHTTELAEKAAAKFLETLLTLKDEWRLRSTVPLLIIKLLLEHRWEDVCRHFSNPTSDLFVDALAVFLLRTRYEKLRGKQLAEMLDLKRILNYWRSVRGTREETRVPVEAAYRYLHEELRRNPRG